MPAPQKTIAEIAREQNTRTAPPQKPPAEKLIEPDVLLWQAARARQAKVALTLTDGKILTGRIGRYGRYSVELLTADGRAMVVFKTAVAHAVIGDSDLRDLREPGRGPADAR